MIGGHTQKKTRENNTYYINKGNNNFREKKIGGFSNFLLLSHTTIYLYNSNWHLHMHKCSAAFSNLIIS